MESKQIRRGVLGIICIATIMQINQQFGKAINRVSKALEGDVEWVVPPWEKHLSSMRQSAVPDRVQELTVRKMLQRLLPKHHHLFAVHVDRNFNDRGKDVFQISSPMAVNDTRVKLKGSTGVAASWGLLHYLKYYCNAHVSWEADQLDLPNPLPSAHVKIRALDRFRYYENVCTVSYSFAWWDWARWQRHIDWMALNGINFPLAFTAQEAIWRRVYARFNFTQKDLDEHFAGPAFLAWGRMGNIQKWGGPLSPNWHKKTLLLQHQILARMRNFGMIPILPGFAGHVPSAITRIYPNAKVSRLRYWGRFTNDNYTRTYLLDPSDDLFLQIGSAFILEMQKEFNGTDHFYNCDTFNEMTPPSSDASYLRSVGKAIFRAMSTADPKAIWVMQGWLFRDRNFWTYETSKAFLTSVPQGKMIVLDLTTEVYPEYPRLSSFFGQPFIFCMLHNYGGVNGFYGNIDILLRHMKDARSFPNGTLVGTGLTPEGINQNYVMYDVMLELSWRKELNVSQWATDYATRRYGSNSSFLKEAWRLLLDTIYNCQISTRFHGTTILIQHRPDFGRQNFIWYEKSALLKIWDLFMNAIDERICTVPPHDHSIIAETEHCKNSMIPVEEKYYGAKDLAAVLRVTKPGQATNESSSSDGADEHPGINLRDTFKHDLVDVSRQVLQVLGGFLIEEMRFAYFIKSPQLVNLTGSLVETLLDDLDLLLGTSKNFLLGRWLQDAVTWATNQKERDLYVSNALYQISLWGPNGEIVDYAVKQWNGVVRDYMKPRYKLFKEALLNCLNTSTDFVEKDFDEKILNQVEKPFANQKNIKSYGTKERGDVIATVKYIYKKYRPLFGMRGIKEEGMEI